MQRFTNSIASKKLIQAAPIRRITGHTDPRMFMKSLQGQASKSLTLLKFAPWGLPVAMIGSWMVYPALGDEKRANFKFLVSFGLMGKNPFTSE
mmetsp:Transcript_33211/g.53637  ORF Transcript_33211/g.53637 Transcript_33211/m.53637 type:complete len:93 (+) Transcript_33211:60-338(+)